MHKLLLALVATWLLITPVASAADVWIHAGPRPKTDHCNGPSTFMFPFHRFFVQACVGLRGPGPEGLQA